MNLQQRRNDRDDIQKWQEPTRPLIDEIEREKVSVPDWTDDKPEPSDHEKNNR